MKSMTLKQMGRRRFWMDLEAYKEALRTGKDIVMTSLAVHIALGSDGVPKSYKSLVSRAYRTMGKE